ncbi:MAG: S8 family serine peptidase [Gammaproteobacteria bacterium]|nr:S8 family serine peptidase [Gammaproteobacteria bacterium]
MMLRAVVPTLLMSMILVGISHGDDTSRCDCGKYQIVKYDGAIDKDLLAAGKIAWLPRGRAIVAAGSGHSVTKEGLALKRFMQKHAKLGAVESSVRFNRTRAVPTVLAPPEQWQLEHMGVTTLWERLGRLQPAKVSVGILDSGIARDHQDLAKLRTPGMDFSGIAARQYQEVPCAGHGTKVAGIIGAKIGNGIGIDGLIPSGSIELIDLRVSSIPNCICTHSVIHALSYAWEQLGTRIFNLSLDLSVRSEMLLEELGYLKSQGVLVVAAVSNEVQSMSG